MNRELKALKKAKKLSSTGKSSANNLDTEKIVDGIEIIPLWRFLLERY